LEIPCGDVNDAIDEWSKHHDLSPLQKGIQAAWDDLACRYSLNSLLNTNNPWNHCRLLAAQKSHTAAWSESFPIASVGNLLSFGELRIAIALQTGAKIFESTKCRCSKIVDKLVYGLSCTKNAGHFPRHSAINSILKRSLTHIGLPFTLEPVSLTNDGRWPVGLTLGPWYRGLKLKAYGAQQLWTLAQGHHKDSSKQASFVATKPEVAKCQKYGNHDLQSNYYFQPVANETTGVYGKSTAPLSGLAKKLDVSGDLGSASGSTVCPKLWSGETLPAYWPVCKFDLILPVLFLVAFNVLNTITACHLPFLHEWYVDC